MRFQVGDLLEFLRQRVLGVLVHSELVLDLLGSVGNAWFGKALVVASKKLAPVWLP